jgi:hypothetical protein
MEAEVLSALAKGKNKRVKNKEKDVFLLFFRVMN